MGTGPGNAGPGTFRVRLIGSCDSRREPQTTLATPSVPRGGPGLDQSLQGVPGCLGLLFLMRYEYFPTLLQLQKVFPSKPEAFGLNCSHDWAHWCMMLWSLKGLRDSSSLGSPGTPEYHDCLHMNEWPFSSAGTGPEMLCGH